MAQVRLYDTNENWGLSLAENARREKKKLRERMRQRQKRALIKMTPPPMFHEQPVEKLTTFRLKGQDVQELGIIAVVTKTTTRPDPMSRYNPSIPVPMSLPWISMLNGKRPAAIRSGEQQ